MDFRPLTDCKYGGTCSPRDGNPCPYRHNPDLKAQICEQWISKKCNDRECMYRHPSTKEMKVEDGERTQSTSGDSSFNRSSSSNSSKLEEFLECAICLGMLNNPRTLKCEHSFCKECIDNIAEFNNNLIVITCPTCIGQQELDDLKDLKAQLIIRQMLDAHNDRNEVKFKCSANGCEKEIASYCVETASYLCSSCSKSHGGLPTPYNFHSVKYSPLDESLLPFCKEHDSFQKICCATCSELCCKYCEHFGHKDHYAIPLQEYNQTKYQENVSKNLEKIKSSKTDLQRFQDQIESQSANINTQEKEFRNTLNERKNALIAKCLYMIVDIDAKYQKCFDEAKSKFTEEFPKRSGSYNVEIAKCNSIIDQESKYEKSNELEKYLNLNQMVTSVRECIESVVIEDPLELGVNFGQTANGDDNLLYLDLKDMFGIVLPENEDDEPFEYKPSKAFKKLLNDEAKVRSWIQTRVKTDLAQMISDSAISQSGEEELSCRVNRLAVNKGDNNNDGFMQDGNDDDNESSDSNSSVTSNASEETNETKNTNQTPKRRRRKRGRKSRRDVPGAGNFRGGGNFRGRGRPNVSRGSHSHMGHVGHTYMARVGHGNNARNQQILNSNPNPYLLNQPRQVENPPSLMSIPGGFSSVQGYSTALLDCKNSPMQGYSTASAQANYRNLSASMSIPNLTGTYNENQGNTKKRLGHR